MGRPLKAPPGWTQGQAAWEALDKATQQFHQAEARELARRLKEEAKSAKHSNKDKGYNHSNDNSSSNQANSNSSSSSSNSGDWATFDDVDIYEDDDEDANDKVFSRILSCAISTFCSHRKHALNAHWQLMFASQQHSFPWCVCVLLPLLSPSMHCQGDSRAFAFLKRANSREAEDAEKETFDQLLGFASNTMTPEDHQLLDSFVKVSSSVLFFLFHGSYLSSIL